MIFITIDSIMTLLHIKHKEYYRNSIVCVIEKKS